jgi:hypothetical protein
MARPIKFTPRQSAVTKDRMRKVLVWIVLAVAGLAAPADAPFGIAIAHEGHHVECTETAINATKADIQAMQDGAAKTKATTEVEIAEDMMGKKDTEGCVAHLHNAMEAVEE